MSHISESHKGHKTGKILEKESLYEVKHFLSLHNYLNTILKY